MFPTQTSIPCSRVQVALITEHYRLPLDSPRDLFTTQMETCSTMCNWKSKGTRAYSLAASVLLFGLQCTDLGKYLYYVAIGMFMWVLLLLSKHHWRVMRNNYLKWPSNLLDAHNPTALKRLLWLNDSFTSPFSNVCSYWSHYIETYRSMNHHQKLNTENTLLWCMNQSNTIFILWHCSVWSVHS